MKFIVLLSLAIATMADTHHNCGCGIYGKYQQELSNIACEVYKSHTAHTNAKWDGYSCADHGWFQGIEADDFALDCQNSWGVAFGGTKEATGSYCWH
ncbi:hypothetical protein E4U21_004628 [Claviceps maximensis]|nr:hypothetical protein E4U21_004628 [Claviceps maximensis]